VVKASDRVFHRPGGIRAETVQRGAFANVPPRTIRKRTFAVSLWFYRQRNHTERFFNRIKQMRGLAARCDCRAGSRRWASRSRQVHGAIGKTLQIGSTP